jgi:tRNA(Ile)-lysidine synthase TilS/MesJ/rhodanese-related sulfurtransferase
MNEEITVEQLDALPSGSYTLIDMRDEYSFSFGHVDGAVNIPNERLLSEELPRDKKLVICCRSGIISAQTADELCEKGYDAVNLVGGYADWLRKHIDDSSKAEDIERSIRKKFARTLWSRFAKAVIEFELVKPGDKIAVCISGGKDSYCMAKLFQELKSHNKFPFELVFLVMDPGYSPENRAIIEKNAQLMNIPITIFETDIFRSVYNVKDSACYLCARMRRGHLYNKAKELGCNKIALGHHYDDVIETILMSMLYGGQVRTMMPKLHSDNFEGMELIRPLYYVREDEIKHWRDYNNLHFIQCACRFTDTCTTCTPTGTGSKRVEIKNLIAELKKTNVQVEANIFRSIENVNLNAVIRYKDKGVWHSFLDDYDDCGICENEEQ